MSVFKTTVCSYIIHSFVDLLKILIRTVFSEFSVICMFRFIYLSLSEAEITR